MNFEWNFKHFGIKLGWFADRWFLISIGADKHGVCLTLFNVYLIVVW